MDPLDRREYPRRPVEIKVDFTSSDSVQSVFSINMSAGGLFLATHRPLPPGSMVLLHMNLPRLDNAVEVLGEVVWNNIRPKEEVGLPEGMGIRFLNMSSLVREHLGTFQSARTANS